MSDLVSRVDQLSRNQVSAMLALGLSAERPQGEVEGAAGGDDPVAVLHEALRTAGADTLPAVVADLKLPVLCTAAPGPLSFERLTSAGSGEVAWLRGKSFLDALTSPQPPQGCLRRLADYGKLLTDRRFPQGTRLTGAFVHTLASHALALSSGRSAEGGADADAAAVLAAISRLAGRA